jgi:hypothetical protein
MRGERATWRGGLGRHLAMRLWPVFLAQVLQFTDQLGASGIRAGKITQQLLVDPREQIWKQFLRRIRSSAGWDGCMRSSRTCCMTTGRLCLGWASMSSRPPAIWLRSSSMATTDAHG